MSKKLNLKKILTSGYNFNSDEYELRLKYILFNSLLIFNILIVSIATFVRFSNSQYINATVDAIYVTLGLISFFIARKSKEYFNALVYFVIFFSFSSVTLAFSTGLNHIAGISWYFLLLMSIFFLKGLREGMIVFIFSFIAIILVTSNLHVHSLDEIVLGVIPFFGALVFMYFFEQRNNELKNLLVGQKEGYLHQSLHDNLTGLANRKLFLNRLTDSLAEAKRVNSKVIVIFIDLDHFKKINDSVGHLMGDMILIEVAKRLSSQIRECDTIARLGGDEYAVMIDTFSSMRIVKDIIQKLLNSMQEPFIIEGIKHSITISLGATVYPDDGLETSILLRNADTAMYKAKTDGKNRYFFYDKNL